MKSKLALVLMTIAIASAGLKGQNVGIHTTTPQHPVDIRQPEGTELGDFAPVFNVKYTGTNPDNVIAILAESMPAESAGIGGYFLGGLGGVIGQVISSGGADYQGVTGNVFGTGTGTYRAVGGNAEGSSGIKQGIYGSAAGDGINWAGYFDEGNVYIQNRLAIGQSAPAARLHITDGALLAEGATGATPVSGPGRRMMWIPAKAAFRAGDVEDTQWDADSIGLYSAAFGRNPKASGTNSFIGGGDSNVASGQLSFVGGGNGCRALSPFSFVGSGYNNWASGLASFVGGGQLNLTSGHSSFVGGGSDNEAIGNFSFVGGGQGLVSESFMQATFGAENKLLEGSPDEWVIDDPLFVIGNGIFPIRHNAVTVLKNGRTGIGRIPTGYMLEVEGDAAKSNPCDWSGNSDERLKKNIQPLDSKETLNRLLALRGITYEWDDNRTGYERPEGIHYGFTAQNIQEVFPTLVKEDHLGYLLTAYGTYDPMMVEALRALDQKIDALAEENQAVKLENAMLRSSLKAFEEKFEAFVSGEFSGGVNLAKTRIAQ